MNRAWCQLPEPRRDLPCVAILLCTFNGALYLREQLESIAAQTHGNVQIWVSDDGSSDQTKAILSSAQQAWGEDRIKLLQGPGQGFARNFLFLTCHPDIEAEYFAFCDQDDIWLPDKLERALACIEDRPHRTPEYPALYGGATMLIDAEGESLKSRTLQPISLGFSNALVQNFASGNTMVFNQALRNHVCQAGDNLNIVSHDWWLYIVGTAFNSDILFDSQPHVRYRQHKNNVIGANTKLMQRLQRLRAMSTGRLLRWLEQNCECLSRLAPQMPAQQHETLATLSRIRRQPRASRVRELAKIKIRRQSAFETCLLKAAILISNPID